MCHRQSILMLKRRIATFVNYTSYNINEMIQHETTQHS